ncbi:MAG: gliding motility-associated C-terminal domain-containing protein [Flavobacteriales bacterium]|nr:gliding motility-associated C-terminal domain-containing protein [Flavobacteriales bacterium]
MQKIKLITLLLTVTLMVGGCTKRKIRIKACTEAPVCIALTSGSFSLPNIFSPNGDGVNDAFGPTSCCGITDFELKIKKGRKLIFESNSPEATWGGTIAGKGVKDGVYDYTVKATVDGTTIDESGTITVITNSDKGYTIDNCQACKWDTADDIMDPCIN